MVGIFYHCPVPPGQLVDRRQPGDHHGSLIEDDRNSAYGEANPSKKARLSRLYQKYFRVFPVGSQKNI
jgi:hypothetical protein